MVLLVLVLWAVIAWAINLARTVSREALWILAIRWLFSRKDR